jgi:hypothetical protein
MKTLPQKIATNTLSNKTMMQSLYFKPVLLVLISFLVSDCRVKQETPIPTDDNREYATRIETIKPIIVPNLMACKSMNFESTTSATANYSVFEGIPDTDGQVDPQVAVGGNYVVHATNSGIGIFNKEGKLLHSTTQACLNDGIDPKLFFDIHNKVFAIDFWHYYDKPKKKPLNLSVSSSADPTKSWNTYPISLTTAEDGGGLGYSKKWIGYTYPKEKNQSGTLLILTDDAKKGKETKIYHFDRDLGQPAFGQDAVDDLYFLDVNSTNFTLNKIETNAENEPYITQVWQNPHQLKYISSPPASAQKGTKSLVASGDRKPKNLVIQGGFLWFAHTVDYEGHAAVQWHQINLNSGKIIQSGIIHKAGSNYIQGSLAVNKDLDVLVGFQETNANMYLSPCFAYRNASTANGTMKPVISIEQGTGNYGNGTAAVNPWGDYSGSILDGDNLKDLWTVQSIVEPNKAVSNRIVRLKL